MTGYQLKVLSPDGELFNGEVISLLLRGADGDLAVFAGHIPFITAVKPGKCVITLPSEKEIEGELTSGILDVGKDETKLLIGDKNAFGNIKEAVG
jgi:F0F1-type ATP synthase, epsilon subunit (mitochondrial delta subunit)